MLKLWFSVICTLLTSTCLAQLKNRVVGIDGDGFCGSFITFESDSVAFYSVGCEAVQRVTKLNFSVKANGELSFSKVPDSLYRPILNLSKGSVPFSAYDSLFLLPRLVILSKGDVINETFWKITGDTVSEQFGTMLSAIPDQFFVDSTLIIHFPDLDKLSDKPSELDYTDFKGDGERFIINADLPPHFINYSEMTYGSAYCKVSDLKFKYLKNELYMLQNKKWTLIPKTNH